VDAKYRYSCASCDAGVSFCVAHILFNSAVLLFVCMFEELLVHLAL